MIVSKNIDELRNNISELKHSRQQAVVGYVPTMGALHSGHLELVKKAADKCAIVVVSIFVNPTQFNDKSDLEKYPRTIENDITMLEGTACDILFYPSEEVIYPDGATKYEIDLNGLDRVMEGKYRKGHFNGVAMVVERLFEIVEPQMAFFGLKDFQQLAVIRQMTKVRGLKVQIIPVETVRSASGLALSSRNSLLTEQEKVEALIIYKTLLFGRELAKIETDPEVLQREMIRFFEKGNLKLEYIEIVDPLSLQPLAKIACGAHACIAAFCGSVRLIDNMQLK